MHDPLRREEPSAPNGPEPGGRDAAERDDQGNPEAREAAHRWQAARVQASGQRDHRADGEPPGGGRAQPAQGARGQAPRAEEARSVAQARRQEGADQGHRGGEARDRGQGRGGQDARARDHRSGGQGVRDLAGRRLQGRHARADRELPRDPPHRRGRAPQVDLGRTAAGRGAGFGRRPGPGARSAGREHGRGQWGAQGEEEGQEARPRGGEAEGGIAQAPQSH